MSATDKSPSRKENAGQRLSTDDVAQLPTPWARGGAIERLALLFDDGGLIVAEADGTIDGETAAALRADLPEAGRLARVRVVVLEIEPRPDLVASLPQGALEILRQVRDTPAIGAKVRAEIDRLLGGAVP